LALKTEADMDELDLSNDDSSLPENDKLAENQGGSWDPDV